MAMKSAFCSVSLQIGTMIVGWTTLLFVLYRALDTTLRIASPPATTSPILVGPALGGNFTPINDLVLSNFTSMNNLTDVFDSIIAENSEDSEIEEGHKDGSYYTFYAYTVLHIIVLACLLYGAHKSRPGFLVPYLVDYTVYIVLLTCVTVLSLVRGDHVTHLAFKIIGIPICVYYLCVVGSFFLELRSSLQISSSRA